MFRLSNNYRLLNNSKNVGILYTPIQWRERHKSFADPANIKFLANLLGVDDSNAIRIIQGYKGKRIFSPKELIRTHAICVRFGIINEANSALPNFLFTSSFVLEHRLSLFKDMGCEKINPALFPTYHNFKVLKVAELKEQQILPADADVTRNLLNCLHKPPPDVPPVESYSDDHTVLNIHTNVLRHYLKWKFQYTDEQVNKIVSCQMTIRCQSLSLLKEMVDLLENEFGFQADKIRRNRYLLSRSPHNTREILDKVKYIGNIESKALIIKYPRLLKIGVDMLQEKIGILKAFNLRDETLSRFPDIYTLSSKTILERLIEFQSITELQAHWTNPRFLMLIFYIKTVKRRMEILKQLNVIHASRYILCTNEPTFQRYITIGGDKNRGTDITRFLSYEFSMETSDPRIVIIKRHSMWCQIPFLYVHESYQFLKQQFSKDDILRNIHLVLYRSLQIEKELKRMDSMRLDPSWKLTPSRKLALCLYNIEKEHHFDGNGMWSCREDVSTAVSPSMSEDQAEKEAWRILRYISKP